MFRLDITVEELKRRFLQTGLMRLAAAYCSVLALRMFTSEYGLDTLAFGNSMSLDEILSWIVILFFLFTALARKAAPLIFSVSLFALCWVISLRYRNYFVILAVSAVFIVFFLYAARRFIPVSFKWGLSERRVARLSVGAVVLLAVIPSLLISAFACVRYLNFSSPNFDFGIFTNMFHFMNETGLPLTTSERNGLLSHFAVHFSPIYYILLPFYKMFPSPLTLQIAQGVVLGSSVVPFYLLCRVKRLGRVAALVFAAAAAFYPGMTGGTFYDLHENCFLMPLLL